MSRVDIVDQLYRKMYNTKTVEFDQIQAPAPLSYFFSPTDVGDLNYIASSNKLSARPDKKYKYIKEIMARRGFKKLASGTNRVVYKFMEDQRIVVKAALDSVGMSDSPNEFYNQYFLKPYCTKVFEVTPCGTLGLFERVHPISSKEEFLSVADDIYDIIINHLIGYYVLDDFGSNYYMNWAVRPGAHPVICDFPYMFQLDGAKINCNKADPFSPYGICGGEIDYDDAFNHLVCKKCGKQYLARDLQKSRDGIDNGILITDKEGDIKMKITVTRGKEEIQTIDTERSSGTYKRHQKRDPKTGKFIPKMTPYEYREAKRTPIFNVTTTPAKEEEKYEKDGTVVQLPKGTMNTVKKEEEKTPKMKPVVSAGKNISDFVEDSNKFNQKTSVSDQPTIEGLVPDNKQDTQVEEEIKEDIKEEEVDMSTRNAIDTIVNEALRKVSGEDEDYVAESSKVIRTLNDNCKETEQPQSETEQVEKSTDELIDEY